MPTPEHPSPALLLRTLGTFELVALGPEGEPVRVMSGQKPLALVAYLALSPGRRATRDRLVELLWRNVEAERARRTLRQTIWTLRQRFGEEAIRNEGEELVLALPLDTDVSRFEDALDAGQLEAAWRWYGGPFLEAFATSGSARFEQWGDHQRDRLRTRWLALAEQLFAQQQAQGRAHEAARIARRIRETAPFRIEHWTRELRSWLAAGDRLEAQQTADAFDEAVRERILAADATFTSLRDQLRAEPVIRVAGAQRLRARPELVGRERTLAALVRAWHQSQRGPGGTVAVLRGSAGIGKTRLLDELAQRVAEGAGICVALRARPVDRDVPFALAASLAEALADLPGALGVSSASADALVELAPALSASYRSAQPRPWSADDQLRVRTLALMELLRCTAEETPLVLLVDDLHWADEASRRLLSSLADRVTPLPVLLVVATRLHGQPWTAPEGGFLVDLTPLGVDHLAALLTGVAAGDPALLDDLAQVLHDVSGGVPLLALAAIDLGLEAQVLQVREDQWICPSFEAFRRVMGQGGILERLMADLPASGLAMLTALSVAGGPLEEPLLLAASGAPDEPATLDSLAARGLVSRTAAGWEVAHDRLVDAVMATVHPAMRRAVSQRCGQAMLEDRAASPRSLQRAGRLLAAADHEAQHRAFRRWLLQLKEPRRWRDVTRSATEFLGDSAPASQVQQLVRHVPGTSRLRHGFPGTLRIAAAIVLLVSSAAGGARAGGWLEPAAAQLILTPPPSSEGFLFDTKEPNPTIGGGARRDRGQGIAVPLNVDFVDRRGIRTTRTPDSVTVRLVALRGAPRLGGTTTRPVVGGHVRFDDLTVRGAGAFVLEARAPALPPQRTPRLFAVTADTVQTLDRLDLLSGTIAEQPVDSVHRRIRVAPNTPLTGTLGLRVTTSMEGAAILLGAVPLWGDRRTNWIVLRSLPPHGETTFSQPLRDGVDGRVLRAPARPGRYRLLLVTGAETEMRFIASGTNWMMGNPVWFNGDDLVDLPASALDSLARIGFARWKRLIRPADGRPAPTMDPHLLTGALLELEVRP